MSARTWPGSAQLRRNRIKPSGSASANSDRSVALSRSPAQLNRIASGIFRDSFDKAAPESAFLERPAQTVGGGLVGQRPRLDSVVDALFPEIGAHRVGGELAEEIG